MHCLFYCADTFKCYFINNIDIFIDILLKINYFLQSSFIEQFFGGTFEVKMTADEAPDEPVTVSTENFLQLSCFISMEVKYMQSGLKSVIINQIIVA